MTVYKKYQSQPFKLILAIIVFMLAMTVTFDDVYGIQVSSTGTYSTGSESAQSFDVTHSTTNYGTLDGTGYFQDTDPITSTPVAPVPEPSSLIFLAMGLGSMYAMRSRRKIK